jgi:hypothetical protein
VTKERAYVDAQDTPIRQITLTAAGDRDPFLALPAKPHVHANTSQGAKLKTTVLMGHRDIVAIRMAS